jgi:P-type conjugative transfer protein TrbL
MGNTGIIDKFLATYSSYINSGFGLLGGEVAFLASTLAAIDITLAALFWALSDEDIIVGLIKKTLYVGFFALLISNWQSFTTIIFNSFSGLGLKAAGSTLTLQQLLQPGTIAQEGLDAVEPISLAIRQLPGSIFSGSYWGSLLGLWAAYLITLLSFFVLAVQLFVILVEFKLTMLAGFILVPFGLFSKTAFLAERVLGNVITSGIKVMMLAIVVGIGRAQCGRSQPSLCQPMSVQSGTGVDFRAGGNDAAWPWHSRFRPCIRIGEWRASTRRRRCGRHRRYRRCHPNSSDCSRPFAGAVRHRPVGKSVSELGRGRSGRPDRWWPKRQRPIRRR